MKRSLLRLFVMCLAALVVVSLGEAVEAQISCSGPISACISDPSCEFGAATFTYVCCSSYSCTVTTTFAGTCC